MGTDQEAAESEKRFAAYVEQLTRVMGHTARERPLRDYCTGLVMPLERKSVEPLAALTEPGHASAQHQSLLHFVGEASWSDEAVQAKVRALPREWTKARERCKNAGVPRNIRFKTKPQIALDQIRAACRASLPRGPVLMDAGYGKETKLRTSLTELGLSYVAGILPQTKMGAEGRRKPHSVEKLALSLPAEAWREVQWREGAGKRLSSRFARVRVKAAHRHALAADDPRAEEWLLVEWPRREKKPTKYMLTTLPKDISFSRMVDIAKLRWRIERDYEELKQEVGLGHFEGRGWRGFHHHATLCIATYGFLVSERETIPPSRPHSSWRSQAPSLSARGRSDGTALAAPTSHAEFDRHAAMSPDLRRR